MNAAILENKQHNGVILSSEHLSEFCLVHYLKMERMDHLQHYQDMNVHLNRRGGL